ncbi:unnamed protein product, partial [Mesorhabditis spiculigera]
MRIDRSYEAVGILSAAGGTATEECVWYSHTSRQCEARGRKRRDTVECVVDDDCDSAPAKCIKFSDGDGGESARCVVVV